MVIYWIQYVGSKTAHFMLIDLLKYFCFVVFSLHVIEIIFQREQTERTMYIIANNS